MTPPTRDLQKTAFSGFEEKFRKLTVIRQRVVFLILEPIVLDPNVIKIESDPGKICAKFFYGFTVWDLSQWTFPVEGPPFDLHDIISPPIAFFPLECSSLDQTFHHNQICCECVEWREVHRMTKARKFQRCENLGTDAREVLRPYTWPGPVSGTS